MLTTLIWGGVAALFVMMAGAALFHLRAVHRLPALEALQRQSGFVALPACSVVIAARDEEARIEQTLRHLLAQENVNLEIIVVDDRSTDGTNALVRRVAQEDARVRLLRVDHLPDGWLGKCHACHIGAQAAQNDWILFTDADCWLRPDVVERALRVAAREKADHITMAPGTALAGASAQAWYLVFLTSLLNWFHGVNTDRPKIHMGIGAFNMVRTSAYRECGGYEALRLTVVDDVKLGLLLMRAGKRTRAFLAADDVECHWGHTVRGMVKIMEKNYFAALDYRVDLVVIGSAFVVVVVVLLLAGAGSGTGWGLAAALSPFCLSVPGSILARRLGWSVRGALLMPLMFPVFFYALWNSTCKTLGQGGIRWRDTFYPLALLRAHNVQHKKQKAPVH